MTPDQWIMVAAVVCEVLAALNVLAPRPPRQPIRFEWLGIALFFATFLTN